MQADLEWASWIVTRRSAIERALEAPGGPAARDAGSPEAEALRRFRSYVAAALRRGSDATPALDGVRADPTRTARLLEAWCSAAVQVAGARGAELRGRLAPLAAAFGAALTDGRMARHARRAPRTGRRAVVAAIDRIADAYLAVDVASGEIVDANPAAAALLRTPRGRLLGAAGERVVRAEDRPRWREELAALEDSDEPRRFRAVWVDALEAPVAVEVNASRHVAARERVLALVVARVL